jgi:hypothetical protein
VHTAVTALNVVWPVRATRNPALPADTRATPLTFASGELASIVTDATPPATLAVSTGRFEPPDVSDVGLPPHALASAAPPASDASWQAFTQNSRREEMRIICALP